MGLGASVGGTEALKEFFASATSLRQAAFVVVQHVEPRALDVHLDVVRGYSPFPVVLIEAGLSLSPGKVFVAPVHTQVTLVGGNFHLRRVHSVEGNLSIIDVFFESLALDQNLRAAGIVFSGEGGDGAHGLRRIGDEGGMTLVQDPATAAHPSMPETAISLGVVDHVLAPAQMGDELQAYLRFNENARAGATGNSLKEQIASALPSVCEVLQRITHHDFRHYKTSTLVRRIQRRMQVLHLSSVDDYLDKLNADAQEPDVLFKELLINVTSFFRDEEAFDAVKALVIDKLLAERPAEQKIRVWVAGCSTGEEVYTLAILFREALAKLERAPEVQIIATDVDEVALRVARRGSYPLTISERVNAERLKHFFIRKGGRYHVTKALRELCLFSSHNVISDPPFAQLDFISCRNMLIYLGPHLQKKLIPVFHYALRAGGYLFLGTSETLTGHAELFRTISAKHRIAQRKAIAVRPPASFPTSFRQIYSEALSDPQHKHEMEVHLVSQRILLDEFAPKYVVVNDEHHIVSVSSGLNAYFGPAEGTFQNSVLKLVRPELRPSLRAALNEAQKHKRKVSSDSAIITDEKSIHRVGVTVQPMPQLGEGSELFMVVFRELGKVTEGLRPGAEGVAEGVDAGFVEQLEHELARVRTDLDKTVQDLEAANEELKSSNEELLSMNEELQSANEELESSKEEIQTANTALLRSNSDLENFLASTLIATLILDEQQRILSFTPHVASIYNVISRDVGRPLTDITHRATQMPPLPSPKTLASVEKWMEDEIRLRDERIFLRRVLPYRNHDREICGAVVTFIDVTELRRSERELLRLGEQLARTQERFDHVADSIGMGVWFCDLPFDELRWSDQVKDHFFVPHASRVTIDLFYERIHSADRERTRQAIDRAIRERSVYDIQFRTVNPLQADDQKWIRAVGWTSYAADGTPKSFDGVTFDVTRTVRAERDLQRSEQRYRLASRAAREAVWDWNLATHDVLWNEAICDELGHPESARRSKADWRKENIHPDDRDRVVAGIHAAIDTMTEHWSDEYRFRKGDGSYAQVLDRGFLKKDEEGRVVRMIGAMQDITERRESEQRLKESESQFRTLANTIPQLAWKADAAGTIYWYNQRWYDYTGMLPSEANGWDWQRFHHPEVLPRVLERWAHSLATGETFEMEFPLRGKDGAYRWFLTGVIPLRDPSGKVLRWFGTNTDIDVAKRGEEEVRRTQQNLTIALEASKMGFWEWDMVAERVQWDERFRADWGLPEGKLFGTQDDTQSLIHPDDVAVVREAVEESQATGEYEAEFRVVRPGTGAEVWIHAKGRMLFDAKGRPVRMMGTSLDVTEQRAFELELNRAKEAAEEASRVKTTFLANMSHEIRTPLGAILGFSELLREGANPTESAQYVKRILSNASQLSKLIDDLLDLSKVEAGHMDVETVAFDPRAIVDDAISVLLLRAQEKGLTIESRWEGEAPTQVEGDPSRLRQILVNVIGNAVKFTERGGVQVLSSLVPTADGSARLRIRMSDTGLGLDEKSRRRIFEPFSQADATITRKYGGTGLGLSLSARLARVMGGQLSLVESTPGRGSVFLLDIRVGLSRAAVPRAKAEAGAANDAVKGVRVLVVDDSPDNQFLLRHFLRAQGAEVESAMDGAEAVRKAFEAPFDIVLMDLQMPVMDGYTAVARLLAQDFRKPVVALTAHAMVEERERCLKAGFREHLSKPVDRALLIELIQRLTK